ncbi:hypothetical protein [Brachybacterium paraconglomeratum]|uniref:hypothetical protein n=1 Tax=Brachybacterium paraconglomeratum TaxID=173362 RepID=UPI0022AEC6B0|nr:hypothetical protein [Brachybacterium paraconglomeratum]MCZ4326412.1 hypothetical protein [Brachybacterium paraconglomeratum]
MSQARSRTPLVLGIIGGVACLGLVLVLVLGGIVGFLVLREGSEPGSGTSTEAGPAEGTGGSTGSGAVVAPPGAAADEPYLELSTSGDGPVVDVYLDFLCPH